MNASETVPQTYLPPSHPPQVATNTSSASRTFSRPPPPYSNSGPRASYPPGNGPGSFPEAGRTSGPGSRISQPEPHGPMQIPPPARMSNSNHDYYHNGPYGKPQGGGNGGGGGGGGYGPGPGSGQGYGGEGPYGRPSMDSEQRYENPSKERLTGPRMGDCCSW
jgi:hypothetical protein